MIHNEDTYYIGYHKTVRDLGAIPALVFNTICGLLRQTDGIGEISNGTLCDLLSITERQLRPIISTLIAENYIEIKKGIGRGVKTIYYITEKGYKNVPFYEQKKVTFPSQKGNIFVTKRLQNCTPLNKGLNKELKEREETPTPLIEKMEDFNFNKFWDLYPGDPNWSYDKENCERVWTLIPKEWRVKLIKQLENGLRWRKKDNDKPIFYLQDYAGQDAQLELPFVRQGTPACTRWLNEAQKAGKTVCVMLISSGDRTDAVFCLESDRPVMEAAGAKYVRDF